MKNTIKLLGLLFLTFTILSCNKEDEGYTPPPNPLANSNFYIKGKLNGVPFSYTGVAQGGASSNANSPGYIQYFFSSVDGYSNIIALGFFGLQTNNTTATDQEFYDYFAPGSCIINDPAANTYPNRYVAIIHSEGLSEIQAQPAGSFFTITDTMHTTLNFVKAVKYKCNFSMRVHKNSTNTNADLTECEAVLIATKE